MSPDVWVPVPLRWRHALQGDVFVGGDGQLWMVMERYEYKGQHGAVACRSKEYDAPINPDDVIQVLVPVSERDALELTREQLGARVVERRTGVAE